MEIAKQTYQNTLVTRVQLYILWSLGLEIFVSNNRLYFDIDSSIRLFEATGIPLNSVTLNIVLPVGISFYTLQTLSYSLDIYFGKLKPQKSLLNLACFVAFFPQLLAGPIVRASDFLPQLIVEQKFRSIDV